MTYRKQKSRTVFVGGRVRRILEPRLHRTGLQIDFVSAPFEIALTRDALTGARHGGPTLDHRGAGLTWVAPTGIPQVLYARARSKDQRAAVRITEWIQ